MEKLKCLQNTMKTTSRKLLIIAGRMPVVRMAKMNTSGIWQSNNFRVQTAASLLAANLLALLRAKRAVRLLLRKQLQRQAKNNISILFMCIISKNVCFEKSRHSFIFAEIFFQIKVNRKYRRPKNLSSIFSWQKKHYHPFAL